MLVYNPVLVVQVSSRRTERNQPQTLPDRHRWIGSPMGVADQRPVWLLYCFAIPKPVGRLALAAIPVGWKCSKARANPAHPTDSDATTMAPDADLECTDSKIEPPSGGTLFSWLPWVTSASYCRYRNAY